MEMDVHAGQSCSQAALENSKCIWENRVIGKSHRGNQNQDIPKQTQWHSETLLEAGRTRGQQGLGGEAEVSAGETALRGEHVSAPQWTQSKDLQRNAAMWSPESPMFKTLPWRLKSDCTEPIQLWPRGVGADMVTEPGTCRALPRFTFSTSCLHLTSLSISEHPKFLSLYNLGIAWRRCPCFFCWDQDFVKSAMVSLNAWGVGSFVCSWSQWQWELERNVSLCWSN